MSNTITLDEARTILNTCTRSELRDHAFRDREVYWERGGEEVGFGYFGGGANSVGVDWEGRHGSFSGAEARALSTCGSRGAIERNDETGPDRYSDGACMPGLTLEGVKKELCG